MWFGDLAAAGPTLERMTLPSGIPIDDLDPGVRPQDDLFQHVNGRWLARTEIPADRARDSTFRILAEGAENAVREIVEEAASAPEGSEERKFGDLYASFMDADRAEQLGWQPISEALAAARAVSTIPELLETLGRLERQGIGGLYRLFVDTDPGQPDRYLVVFAQAGISLPDESYYREERFAASATPSPVMCSGCSSWSGCPDADRAASRVFALETAVAGHHWDNVASRDREKTYNLYTWTGLLSEGPDLRGWLAALDPPAGAFDEIVLRQPSFSTGLASLLTDEHLPAWRDWLCWQVIHGAAGYLSEAFVQENFDFYGRTLSGTPQLRERWKRGVSLVERAMGEAVGRAYVGRHFPPGARERMDVLVANLLEAYRQSIEKLEWMGADTRRRALDKLGKFTPKIGYPARWRDYSSLRIDPADLMANVRAAHAFEFHRQLSKIGQPIDRDEWFMTPQMVNAYYNAGMNEIVFPAAILQDPFFDPGRDDAANYGAIGAVIGHEIGHGFDDQGSKYDGDGRLPDWWSRDGPAGVRGPDPVADRAVQRPGAEADSGPACERSADDRGEHRGPRRPRHRVEGLPGVAARRAGAGHRRPDRRPALLPVVGAGLAGEGPGRGSHPAARHRPAFPRRVPLQPDRAEPRRVLRRV